MYELPCARPQGTITAAPRRSDGGNLKNAVDGAISRLRNAERPLIWAGVEIERFDVQDQFKALIEKLKIPYATSLLGKAVIAEDLPQYVGVFEGPSSPQYIQDVFNNSDYILALGVWMTDENLLGTVMPWDHMTLAARDSVKTDTAVFTQVTLADFIDGLSVSSDGLGPYGIPQVPLVPPLEPVDPNAQVTYQGFYNQVRDLVKDTTIVCGGTGFNWFGSSPLRINVPGGYIAQAAYADIGYVVPASSGVALAAGRDHRVLVFAGDGGFQMTAQAISTMAAHNLNPIIFLLDNGVYGIEQWLAGPEIYRSDEPFYPLSVLHRWDYAKLCEALGGKGWKVETYAQLKQAMDEAVANTNGPSLIQVTVPSKSIPELAEWRV